MHASAPTAESVGSHYDALDHFYRDVWGPHLHHGLWTTGRETLEEATAALVDFVAGQAMIQPGDTVCDLGCGYGETARILERSFGALVTGLTVSSAQQRHAESEAHGPQRSTFLCRDWLSNGLPDAHFDALLAIESTEHMSDRASCFNEVSRVLKPQGRAVVCSWLAKESAGRLPQTLLLRPLASESRMHPLETETQYRAHLQRANLSITGFTDLSSQVCRTWPACISRFLRELAVHPGNVKFLLTRHRRNRGFALTALRIWIGFKTGGLRYGVFTAEKTDSPETH